MGDRANEVPQAVELMSLLAEIERRSRHGALNVPVAEVSEDVWDGLAYSVAGGRVVSGMDEIREMHPYPSRITSVPGSHEWMRGLTNVRGNLLSVVDLQLFLGAKAVVPGKAARMLIIRMRGLECGLLVPSVQGMRHFQEAQRIGEARMKGLLGKYVFEAFSMEDEIWPVFSISALTADPAFRSAAG